MTNTQLIPKKYVIGAMYTTSWANNSALKWQLKSYNGNNAILVTPKSKRELECKLTDLREVQHKS